MITTTPGVIAASQEVAGDDSDEDFANDIFDSRPSQTAAEEEEDRDRDLGQALNEEEDGPVKFADDDPLQADEEMARNLAADDAGEQVRDDDDRDCNLDEG